MKDAHLVKLANMRSQSREIVKEILNFGVTETQKLDIIYMLSLELESIECMKEIASLLKKYRESINKDKEDDNVNKSKILTV